MKGGLGQLMKQAQKLQEDMQQAQNELASMEVEGEAGAGMVRVTMTGRHEMEFAGASAMGEDLEAAGVLWRHLPVTDLGAPSLETCALWPEASEVAHRALDGGGRVLAHCYGGCGRSGMALLRLMAEAGEDVDMALARLRSVRPCAVETTAQQAWAALGSSRK